MSPEKLVEKTQQTGDPLFVQAGMGGQSFLALLRGLHFDLMQRFFHFFVIHQMRRRRSGGFQSGGGIDFLFRRGGHHAIETLAEGGHLGAEIIIPGKDVQIHKRSP